MEAKHFSLLVKCIMKHNKYSIMIFLRKLNFDKILKEKKKRFIVAMNDKVTI
jgi:hypothetical protein